MVALKIWVFYSLSCKLPLSTEEPFCSINIDKNMINLHINAGLLRRERLVGITSEKMLKQVHVPAIPAVYTYSDHNLTEYKLQ